MPKSIKRIIICPLDGTRHIDKGKFAKTPHTRHLCKRKVRGRVVKHFFTVKTPSIGI